VFAGIVHLYKLHLLTDIYLVLCWLVVAKSEPVVIGNVRVSLQTDLMYVWSDVDCHMTSASVTAGLTYSGSTQPGVHLGPRGWKLAELRTPKLEKNHYGLDSIEPMKISNADMEKVIKHQSKKLHLKN